MMTLLSQSAYNHLIEHSILPAQVSPHKPSMWYPYKGEEVHNFILRKTMLQITLYLIGIPHGLAFK